FHELKDFDFRLQSQTFSSTIVEGGWPLGFYRFTQDGDFSRGNILRLAFDIFGCGSIVMLSAMILESARQDAPLTRKPIREIRAIRCSYSLTFFINACIAAIVSLD